MNKNKIFEAFGKISLIGLLLMSLLASICAASTPNARHERSPYVSSTVRKVMAGSDGTNAIFLRVDSEGRLILSDSSHVSFSIYADEGYIWLMDTDDSVQVAMTDQSGNPMTAISLTIAVETDTIDIRKYGPGGTDPTPAPLIPGNSVTIPVAVDSITILPSVIKEGARLDSVLVRYWNRGLK